MTQKRNSAGGVLLLMLTALIWGGAFVAQSKGMDSLGAFAFGSIRTLLGSFSLFIYILISNGIKKAHRASESATEHRERIRTSVLKGIPLGVVYFIATNFQQYAFYYSTAGKIAFITAMYILFVPVADLFAGRKLSAAKWAAVALGIIGLWLLCIGKDGMGSVSPGDILALACSVGFTFHIILIDRCSGTTDGAVLSCTQFLVAGAMTFVLMLVFEGMPSWQDVASGAVSILYAGIMSCAVAYTLQIIGQKSVEPSVASLIMSLESVFAVICAALILRQVPSAREGAGCAVMFAAIILAQSGDIFRRRKEQMH